MKIGELSKISGLSVDTIRFYEKNGLVKNIWRKHNNYRDYDKDQFSQFMFIKQCRSIGLSLSETMVLLSHLENPQSDCAEVNSIISSALVKVEEQLKLLRKTKSDLQRLNQMCGNSGASLECGIMQKLKSAGF